jgi:hypothetical protein
MKYSTTMKGSKTMSQPDAYKGSMNAAIKGTKTFGLIPKKKLTPMKKKATMRARLNTGAEKMLFGK